MSMEEFEDTMEVMLDYRASIILQNQHSEEEQRKRVTEIDKTIANYLSDYRYE